MRNPGRKLFNKERKKIFLEWFAGTANMSWAAEVAGVSYKTVSKHILKDPDFAGEVHEAMQLGVLRAKAKMLETSRQPTKIGIDGEIEVPELDMTRFEAQQAVREHERTLTFGRKPGRVPRIAGNAEVLAVVRKRFKVFAARVRARGGSGDGSPSGSRGPLHQPAPSATAGPPPRAGEE
ncbi:MAG TPA: hypothetical protein VEW25_07970 [Allosphingosinicella sp.]|nr:hypothetical protein [Allosphingosinicella sp.]